MFCLAGCRDWYRAGSWRPDQHAQNQRAFWEGHWEPAAHVNQQTRQIPRYSPGSEGLCAGFGGMVLLLSPKDVDSSGKATPQRCEVVFYKLQLTSFHFSIDAVIVVWDSGEVILCKDLRKNLQYLTGENKKKLIFPLLPLERNGKMVYRIHDETWLDYFSDAIKKEKMRIG